MRTLKLIAPAAALLFLAAALLVFGRAPIPRADAALSNVSDETEACLECHRSATPGIVAAWEKSRHARSVPMKSKRTSVTGRGVSSDKIPEELSRYVVGCAECHAKNAGKRPEAFEHDEFKVYSVVTPDDCARCHSEEASQFSGNLKSNAWANLMENKLYRSLADSINGIWVGENGSIEKRPPGESSNADSCLVCHGTKLEISGFEKRETDFGEMSFPVIEGWPNRGVGRVNLDGSKGSCSACHSRHEFSVAVARSPSTCAECHKGPDVPAYGVYKVSAHGKMFEARKDKANMTAIPWTPGKDFSAPTCAACHVSLLADSDGEVISERTHRMNDRLPDRLFGLVYSHPHPLDADTTKIVNKNGQPLPTALDGTPAAKYLVDEKERQRRRARMSASCLHCHSTSWVNGHFKKLEQTSKETNSQVRAATALLEKAWSGDTSSTNLFDDAIEKKWVEVWLFYANSIRFASAMGGADYGVFEKGRWEISRAITEIKEELDK